MSTPYDSCTPAPYEFPVGDARFKELMGRVRATSLGKSVSASEWSEIEEAIMGEDSESLAGAVNQAEYDKGAVAGRGQERSLISQRLAARAGGWFAQGNDEEAKRLRRIAKAITDGTEDKL